ncbi:MAG: thiol peroxidase [Dermatophilaceae bacterium]
MATTVLGGRTVSTVGELPVVGSTTPGFTLTTSELTDVSSADLRGRRVVLNIFPSVATGVCARSSRTFNEIATGLENTTVLTVSADLPFALGAFCAAEGIDNITMTSSFRSTFGADYGVAMADGAWRGLLARSIVVLDPEGTVIHCQLVSDIGKEPDYDAVVAALR